jgi:hypothetical protein
MKSDRGQCQPPKTLAPSRIGRRWGPLPGHNKISIPRARIRNVGQFPNNFHADYDACSNGGLRFYGGSAISTIRCIMPALDLIVIGFGSFVAIVGVGIVGLLAAHRH